MDGVLADFNTAARHYLRATAQDEAAAAQAGRWPAREWRRLVAVPNFYRHLPKMPEADELVKLAQRFQAELGWDIRILTAIPTNNEVPDVFQDKFDWMAEHYPGIRLCFGPYSHDKHRHAQPGDILVDDRTSNCNEWRTAGGIAVQVHSGRYQHSLQELTKILEDRLSLQRLRDIGS
jgi:5'(3')-deoxyribonucleotidase